MQFQFGGHESSCFFHIVHNIRVRSLTFTVEKGHILSSKIGSLNYLLEFIFGHR
jgi:hypothetical protein